MAKDDEKKTVTLDVDALNELIQSKIREGLAEARAKDVVEGTDFDAAMRKIRGGDVPPANITYEECISPLTGARFRAKIMASRSSPLGRLVDISEAYTLSEEYERPMSQGGKMPDSHTTAPKETHEFWKYWEFFRRDALEFVGKPFTRYLLVSEHEKRTVEDRVV